MQEQIGKVTIQYREEEILLQTEALEDARIRELLAEGYDGRKPVAGSCPPRPDDGRAERMNSTMSERITRTCPICGQI